MRRFIGAMIAVVVSTATGLARPAAPQAGHYSTPQYKVVERRGIMVPMRDQVLLSVDLYLPEDSRKLPGIMALAHSDRDSLRSVARWFATRGYAFVAADARGRFNSEGTWDPFNPKHKSDGYDLVEWIAQQPWSNGKVGMWGSSYLGWTQWWAASTAPPHLAAIAPQSAPADQFYNGPYVDGVLIGGWMQDWACLISGRTFQRVGDGPYGGWSGRREDLKHTPYSDLVAYRGIEGAPWVKKWYQQNRSTDVYWSGIEYQDKEHYSKMTVPSVAFTGWFDVSHTGSILNYAGMKTFGATPEARRPALVIGPWTHDLNERVVGGIDYGPEATIDLDGYTARWFDHFLKGIDNGVDKGPPVFVFVMGENKWHAEQDWPLPEAQPTTYYLTSAGHASSPEGDGILSTTRSDQEAADNYLYDPRHPTLDPSTHLQVHNGNIDGAWDTRLTSKGGDVLIYQTPPLKSAVEVTGPIEATLYAATSARDTDWMVRLVDVQPDGRDLLLADGAIRARNRDPDHEGRFNGARLSTIEPGNVYQYTISFWRGTSNLFQPGHRIRLEISSSWFPFFLPNLNTGADNLAQVSLSEAVVARQTVHHGPRYPSRIILPVIPPRKNPD